MIEKKVHQLKIDKAFKNLIRPLQRKEYLQLEADIIENGCKEPIETVLLKKSICYLSAGNTHRNDGCFLIYDLPMLIVQFTFCELQSTILI